MTAENVCLSVPALDPPDGTDNGFSDNGFSDTARPTRVIENEIFEHELVITPVQFVTYAIL